MIKVSFKDGIEATIGKEESFYADTSIYLDNMNCYLNIYGGSVEDLDFNNSLSRNDKVQIFNKIDNRLGGIFSS